MDGKKRKFIVICTVHFRGGQAAAPARILKTAA